MKELIAAAALAVAGTGASAAFYEVNFTATITDLGDSFSDPRSVGDEARSNISFYTQDSTAGSCSVLFATCEGGAAADFNLASDGSVYSFLTLANNVDTPLYVNFETGTGYVDADFGVPDSNSVERLSFSVSDVETQIDGVSLDPEITPVPLPASAPLLAVALGGMAWWRRRAA